MDFFQRQEKARRNTKLLVFYFVLAVALILAAVYLTVAMMFGRHELWNPTLFLYAAGGTLTVILAGSVHKILELAQGGRTVATMLGGRPVNQHSADPDERKLLNVVEEMSIASGVAVPEVYVLPAEEGINAFAAGNSTSDAVVGVTKGCMRLLTRDELQGVIAHEFSHILNGDMRLNIRLMGIVSGILLLAVIGRILLRTRGRKNPLPLFGLLLLIIGSIGVLFGRLIKSAVSRQREYLADAAAVQFTRNPDGLAGALKKIGGLVYGSRMQSAYAEEASHLFFGNGLAESWSDLMSTHPPLAERIRAIDPSFDGKFPALSTSPRVTEPARSSPPPLPARPPRPIPAPQLRDLLGAQLAGTAVSAATAESGNRLPRIGTPEPKHLRYAADFKAALPEILLTASTESLSATALLCGMLLSPEATVRQEQLRQLQSRLALPVYEELLRLLPYVAALPAHFKLPLVTLTIPALRGLSPAQYAPFKADLQFIIEHDREIDLFEYALQKIIVRHLDPHFGQTRRGIVQYHSLKPLLPECAVLLSALARIGNKTSAQMAEAFLAGAQHLGVAEPAMQLLKAEDSSLAHIDAALNRLAQASPMLKKSILTACALTVVADEAIQLEEAELLRAIADTLDCPVPPFVEGV